MHLSNWNIWNGHSKYSQLEVTMRGWPFQHNCSLGQMVNISQRFWGNVSFGKYSTMITWSCLKLSCPRSFYTLPVHCPVSPEKEMVTEMGFVKFYMREKRSLSDTTTSPMMLKAGRFRAKKKVQSILIHWHLMVQLHRVQNMFLHLFIHSIYMQLHFQKHWCSELFLLLEGILI